MRKRPELVRASSDMTAERMLVTIEPGKETRDVTITMSPATFIEGHVVDPDGRPSSGASLRVYTTDGQTRANFGRVNSDGNFKVQVEPGKLIIGADYLPAETDSLKTYFPGVVDLNSAVQLDLLEGETRSDLNFRLQLATRVHVSGIVTDPMRSSAASSGTAYLAPQERLRGIYPPTVPVTAIPGKENSQFEFEDIRPGKYTLFVVMQDDASSFHIGKMPVAVDSDDVKGLAVTVYPEVEIKGRIISSVLRGPNDPVITPRLGPASPEAALEIPPMTQLGKVTFDSKFDFTISNISEGEYVIGLTGLPPDTALIEAREGTRRLLNNTLTVTHDAPKPLTLIVGPGGAITGIVSDSNGKPVPFAPVMLLTEKSARLSELNLGERASADASGNYRFRGIPPGNYIILSFYPQDPSEFQRNESRGYPVSVTPGSATTINLPLLGGTAPR